MGLFSKPDIAKMKAKNDVKGLIGLLHSRNYEIKHDAIRALEELRDARAVRPLFERIIQNTRSGLSGFAKDAIVRIGQPAVGPLTDIMKEGNGYFDIINMLARIADPASVGSLINALNYEILRENASIALQRIGRPAVMPLISALKHNRYAADVLRNIGDSGAVEILAAMLSYGTPAECSSAAIFLGQFGDIRALDVLLGLLKDNLPDVRRNAARVLVNYTDKRIMAELGTLLRDPDPSVRLAAAETLSKFGSAKAIRHLIALLQDNKLSIRLKAAKMLGNLNMLDLNADLCSGVVQALVLALQDEAADLKEAAAAALAKICASSYLPLLTMLKEDYYRSLRQVTGILEKAGWQPSADEAGAAYWIAKARWDKCVEIGVPAVPQLLEAVRQSDSCHRKVVDSLIKIGIPAVELLIASLGDNNALVRVAAAEALGSIGDHRAVEPLIIMLKDREEKPRQAAVTALGKLSDLRAVEPLAALLADDKLFSPISEALASYGQQASGPLLNALSQGTWTAQVNAARVLGQIREPRAVVPLISMYSRGSNIEKALIAEALGNIGDMQAFETLMDGFINEKFRDSEGPVNWHNKFVHALILLGTPARLRLNLMLLNNGSSSAAQALAEMYDISKMMNTESTTVLQGKARRLFDIDGTLIVEESIIQIALNPDDLRLRQCMIEIIEKNGKPAIDRLTALFRDEALTRYAIISVVRQLNNAEKIFRELDVENVLTSDLKNGGRDLRRIAYLALRSLPSWQPKDEEERLILDKVREQMNQDDVADRFTELNRKYGSRP